MSPDLKLLLSAALALLCIAGTLAFRRMLARQNVTRGQDVIARLGLAAGFVGVITAPMLAVSAFGTWMGDTSYIPLTCTALSAAVSAYVLHVRPADAYLQKHVPGRRDAFLSRKTGS